MSDRTDFEPDNPLGNLVASLLADMQALHTELAGPEDATNNSRSIDDDDG